MSEPHGARVRWERNGAAFSDGRYSRGHRWSFDGGIDVPASSAPGAVPVPLSVEEAVDPEEAVVAAAASCHMLWFLAIAAKRGFVVDGYDDQATGTLGRDAEGKTAFTRITLRPRVAFAEGKAPSTEEHRAMHDKAHHACFIANSLKCGIDIDLG